MNLFDLYLFCLTCICVCLTCLCIYLSFICICLTCICISAIALEWMGANEGLKRAFALCPIIRQLIKQRAGHKLDSTFPCKFKTKTSSKNIQIRIQIQIQIFVNFFLKSILLDSAWYGLVPKVLAIKCPKISTSLWLQ